jgi:hypothetical protein
MDDDDIEVSTKGEITHFISLPLIDNELVNKIVTF